jgi:hypothetical protein
MRFFFVLPGIFGVRTVVEQNWRPPGEPSSTVAAEFVYVVTGDHDLVKIGITTNPKARLASLRTGSPFPIDFAYVATVEGPAIDIEQRAHASLARHRCQGEWFDVVPEVAVGAVAAAAHALGRQISQVDPNEPSPAPLRPHPPVNRGMSGGAFVTMCIALLAMIMGIELRYMDYPYWLAAIVGNLVGAWLVYLLFRLFARLT